MNKIEVMVTARQESVDDKGVITHLVNLGYTTEGVDGQMQLNTNDPEAGNFYKTGQKYEITISPKPE